MKWRGTPGGWYVKQKVDLVTMMQMHLHVFPTQLVDTRLPRPQCYTLTTCNYPRNTYLITIDDLNDLTILTEAGIGQNVVVL